MASRDDQADCARDGASQTKVVWAQDIPDELLHAQSVEDDKRRKNVMSDTRD